MRIVVTSTSKEVQQCAAQYGWQQSFSQWVGQAEIMLGARALLCFEKGNHFIGNSTSKKLQDRKYLNTSKYIQSTAKAEAFGVSGSNNCSTNGQPSNWHVHLSKWSDKVLTYLLNWKNVSN